MTAERDATLVRPAPRLPNWMLVALDAALVVLVTVIAYYARFEGVVPAFFERWMWALAFSGAAVYVALFVALRLYRVVLRYVGLDTLLRLFVASVLGFALLVGIDMLLPIENEMRPVPLGVLFFQSVLVFIGASGVRVALRVFLHLHATRRGERARALVVGAGSAGPLLLREIQSHPDLMMTVVGFLDDDAALHGRTIDGVPVLGGTARLPDAVRELDVHEVIVAMPHAPDDTVCRIVDAAAAAGVPARVMPQLITARGSVSMRDLRPIEASDLLGRELSPVDSAAIRATFAGAAVAVTGAAGSVGSELSRQLLGFDVGALLLIDIDETRLLDLWQELDSTRPGVARTALLDVTDTATLSATLMAEKPSVVFHCAAYKSIPMAETSPAAAVRVNVGGTRSVIDACERAGVGRLVLASTDKAAAPATVVAATQLLAEQSVLEAARRGSLDATVIRFGNVVGTRGSVVPTFQRQLRQGGPLTVTDPAATRRLASAPEVARLVLQAYTLATPGDVLVLDAGREVRIAELAEKMIALSGVPAEITYVGLRPGETAGEPAEARDGLERTTHDRVLRLAEAPAGAPEISGEVDALLRRASAADRDGVLDLLGRLVPAFAKR